MACRLWLKTRTEITRVPNTNHYGHSHGDFGVTRILTAPEKEKYRQTSKSKRCSSVSEFRETTAIDKGTRHLDEEFAIAHDDSVREQLAER